MWACLWLCLVCGLLQFELCIACRVSFSLKVELSTVGWPGCYWPLSVFPSLEFLISVSCLLYHGVPLYSVHEIPIQISCTLRCCVVFRRMVKIGNLLELVSGYVQMLQLRKQGPNWLFFCFASSLATWDAIRSSNAPSGGSHGSPRSPICWKPLSETWDAPNCDGNNKKTHCATAGPATTGAAASATAAASYPESN